MLTGVKYHLNKKGMGLVEVIVATGLMVIVGVGLTAIVTTMGKEQNNQARVSTLRELKTRFQFLISDQNSWNQTLQNNPSMACVANKETCAAGIYDLTLYDGGGTPFFIPPPNAVAVGAGSRGFTDRGTPCAAFNGTASAGVDACPISYKVVWEPICTGTCKNPLIRVTVRMMYNPSPSLQVTAIPIGNYDPTTAWTDDAVASNTGKYDVAIKRSATTVNKAFTISISRINGAADGPGGGECALSPATTILGNTALVDSFGVANPPWVEKVGDDPFDLVSAANNGLINMKAGTYSCKMSAVAWAVDSFSIHLVNHSTGVVVAGSNGASNASSLSYAQATATSSPVVGITANTNFRFEQSCQNPNYVQSTGRRYNLGLPVNPYSIASTFATFTCTQTN